MLLAKDLLRDIRYSLSDVAKDRWTDERLLSLMTSAVKDIAKNTILFLETVIVTVQDDVADVDLSDRATKVVRAEYLDEPLDFKTFDEMDRRDRRWQLDKGDKIKCLVYDNQKRAKIRLYPVPVNAQSDYITYPNGLYGIVTDISYSDVQPVMHDHYGDISGVPDEALIKFYYVRKHDNVTDVDQELHVDELCEDPIKHYVVGHALRDNVDAQNRTFGTEELNRYYQMVNEFSIQREENFARVTRETQYRPMG